MLLETSHLSIGLVFPPFLTVADTRVIAQNADSIIIVPEEETSNEIGDASLFLQQANPQDDVPGMVSSDFEEATDLPEEVQELPIDLNLRQEEQENVETQQMVDMIPPSLGQDEDGSSYADDQDVDKEPSIVQLLIAKLGIGCCFCCCGNSFATQQEGYFYGLSTWGIIWLIFRWLLRFVGQGLSMYMIIVNIGATQQGNYAIQKFPTVHGILYEGQNEGPVCAYLEPWIDETTRTFPNATTATMEGYEIAHCGACAACSTWHNLELQWSTRNNLAILSNKCAKKQIFGGYEKALDCHLGTIGFDIPCSNCWIDVEACAIHHCSFIQMQAWIIANLGNFEVGPGTLWNAYNNGCAVAQFILISHDGAGMPIRCKGYSHISHFFLFLHSFATQMLLLRPCAKRRHVKLILFLVPGQIVGV